MPLLLAVSWRCIYISNQLLPPWHLLPLPKPCVPLTYYFAAATPPAPPIAAAEAAAMQWRVLGSEVPCMQIAQSYFWHHFLVTNVGQNRSSWMVRRCNHLQQLQFQKEGLKLAPIVVNTTYFDPFVAQFQVGIASLWVRVVYILIARFLLMVDGSLVWTQNDIQFKLRTCWT